MTVTDWESTVEIRIDIIQDNDISLYNYKIPAGLTTPLKGSHHSMFLALNILLSTYIYINFGIISIRSIMMSQSLWVVEGG